MSSPGYEEVEHTADLGLHVWGEDFYSLLNCSAKGMYQMMGISSIQSLPERLSFKISTGSKECILVDFLNELLFFCEDKKIFLDNFQFHQSHENIAINAVGYKFHQKRRLIKAVTFHNLEVKMTDFGLDTIITFDV